MSAALRVADVIRSCWEAYNRAHRLPPHVGRAVRHILRCRTAALGGHIHECDQCGSEVPMYNSCQDRHCPTCQTSAKEKWLDKRREELLPVQYFHSVFTLPHLLNALIDANRKLLLGELFSTVNWVLQAFAHDPQWRLEGELGFIAVLHTWTQKLQEHFHLHCIVPGGVWRADTGEWIHCHARWLFKKDSLAAAFRNRYIKRLCALRRRGKLRFSGAAASLADESNWNALIAQLQEIKWIVYPKPAPAGAEIALEYLGRYTHKVAISDYRIKALANGRVTYSWRDRDDNNIEKLDTIPVAEFTKRFCYHILPRGFMKIRYYGWLSSAKRKTTLPAIRGALNAPHLQPEPDQPLAERIFQRTGVDITLCPRCRKGHLRHTGIEIRPQRGPP
jgi:hypothetical protein